MKQILRLRLGRALLCGVLLLAFAAPGNVAAAETGITSRNANVDGVQLHYLIAGKGPAVLLLHGYAETSRMWRPLLPLLAAKHTVIAPDLPGIGDSATPASGIDMITSAERIHALLRSLGVEKAAVVGHDIGLMVAYAYAAKFPSETEKLALMDAFLPGVEGWEPIYDSPDYWHFRFHGPTPEALVKGREAIYFAYFWNDLAADKNHSLPKADRAAYVSAYSKPGRMRAAWAYFASWPQLAKDFAKMSQTRLTMPVLSIGGDKSLGGPLAEQARRVADHVTVVVLKDSGHWILEEKPKETTEALLKFLE
jgi:pimeloyl-ACP methyl ester carboxylesterase